MAVNLVIQQGRIPFDLELKNGDDDNKAFLGFSISVKRDYKPEGEQYYPEDLMYCKAFKQKAKFIASKWAKGDEIIVEGKLRRDDDYEKDGVMQKGQIYIMVDDVHFVGKRGDSAPAEEAAAKPAAKASTPAAKTGGAPAARTPGLNPLGGGAAPKKKLF